MQKITAFIDGIPTEIDAELYQHGIKIRDSMLHYFGVEKYLMGDVLLLSIESDTGFISPIIPALPSVGNTSIVKEIEKVKTRIGIAKSYLESVKNGVSPDINLDELLPYLKIGEMQYINLIRENPQMAIKIPMELSGRKMTAELDSKTSIMVISNRIPLDKSKIKEEGTPIGIRTVNGLSYVRPFKMDARVNGKHMEIRAVQMNLPNEDALIDPNTALHAGVKLTAEGIQK